MATIDELGYRAARDALADAERTTDVEAGLARILAGEELEPTAGPTRRRWVVLLAAAAIVAAVVAGVVWARQDPSSRMVPSTVPEPTPEPTTTAAPTTTASPTTSPTTSPPVATGLSVSYRNPPPVLEPDVFATINLPDDNFFDYFAVTESGGAVTIDHATGEAVVIDLDGSTRRVPLETTSPAFAAGPGDVLYTFQSGPGPGDLSIVAVALSGERAGEVVASSPLDPALYTELPTGAFGHGPTGILDRSRQVGEQVIGYVGPNGGSITWPDAPPLFVVDDRETVRPADGSMEWPLEVERHPDAPTPLEGPSPPAPTTDGAAVYWTGIGPPDDPASDFPANTINVIAVLHPDGSVEWHRLADGWSVAASDAWGTILTHRVGDQVELATLTPTDETSEPTTPPSAPPAETTTPSTTPPVSRLATLAEAIGASTAIARAPGTITEYADETTTEVTTPPDVYVQTDGNLLWWNTVTGDTVRSTAATLDGTVVCDVAGSIHRVRQEADGGYVASVERVNETAGSRADETPVPNYAVDCESGIEQSIETVTWLREVGARHVEHVRDHPFTAISDAEGNADVTNESGVSINGDDYAGYHEFSADGSRVVYGDMRALGSPHVTNLLRSRDTTTGEVLWSAELDRPVSVTYWYGDRIVALAPSGGVPGTTYEAVIVLDASTGDVITTVPTSLDIAFVG
jgi:hypothetical protein